MINHNPETGIRYGIIPVRHFIPEIFYEACQPVYNCENCEHKEKMESDEGYDGCDMCEDFENIVDEEGMKMKLGEDDEVWVFKSEHTTRCEECSPCAPNAGFVTDQDDLGEITYCPNPEWLRNPEKLNIKKIQV